MPPLLLIVPLSSLLMLLLSAVVRTGAEDPSCPCLTTDSGALDIYKIGGQLYYNSIPYPNDYGTGGCRAYDTDPSALQPFCGNSSGPVANAPAWCFDSFCYVDRNNCSLRNSLTGVFPDSGLYYSYVTCGTDSTFEDWFGVNGTAASSNNLDDLADVVEDYIKALRTDIEDTYQEYSTLTTSCENTHTGCPCSTCELTPGWGAGIMVDFDSTMFKPHAVTPATPRSTCLSQSMHSFFTKIAGSEYHDTSKFANLYGGFQEDGSLSMYPEYSWCTTDYDPRFRPWYSTAVTNPKVLIVVLDVSGSMRLNGRITLAREAALAVLDTLTWNDHVGFVLFNSGIKDTYPVTACTDANRILMKTWATNNIDSSGNTNFILPLEEAFSMIEGASTSACTKAIIFLTDGSVRDFTEANFATVAQKAEANSVVIFTYALGEDANITVTRRLACDNSGIFYKVPDGADLSEVMSSYYSYFAASISYTGARWILYNDFSTNTELLSACTPMYDTSDATAEIAVLIGVICMDINMMVDVSRLRAHAQWDSLYSRVLDTSKQCSDTWVGISAQYKLTILEQLRANNAGNGAELCNNEESADDDSSTGFPIMIPIIIGCGLLVMVIVGAVFHHIVGKNKVSPEGKSNTKTAAATSSAPPSQATQNPPMRVHIQPQPQPQVQQQRPVYIPLQQQPQYIQPQRHLQQPVVVSLPPQQQQQQPAQMHIPQPQYVQPPQQQQMAPQYIQPQQNQQQHQFHPQSMQPQCIQPGQQQHY